jgi:hypothetical protein
MTFATKGIVTFLKKYPVAIGCGVLSVVLLAGSYIRNSRASDLVTLMRQKEEEGQKILDNIRNGTNLPEQFETLSAATKGLEARLVHAPERARNQQYFYRIESDTGVKELSLQPNPASPAQQRGPKTLYTGISYTITVQGDYRQILNFVGHLESGPYFYRLISASVSRQGQRGGPNSSPTINLSLNLELLGLL